MPDLSVVGDLKNEAKVQRQRGDLAAAARALEAAIDVVARELADLYGMLGGAHRDQGDLGRAASAYDAGFQLEARFDSTNSYNALNRVVTRLLRTPAALEHPDVLRADASLEFVDVTEALSVLEQHLERDLRGARTNDFWAAGDLVVTAALNGRLDRARDAVTRFFACHPPPPPWAVETYVRTLRSLQQLDTPHSGLLADVIAQLEGAART